MTDFIDQGAEFSADRVYRYRLWRRWEPGPVLLVIGLNPSTADETVDDPTIRRCIGYARRWGFAGLTMMNLFAFRATDPREMRAAFEPVGQLAGQSGNDDKLLDAAHATIAEGGAVLAAWGNHGVLQDRGWAVYAMLHYHFIPTACLGRTQSGQPKHPLYLAGDTQPIPFILDGGRLCTAVPAC